MQITDRAKDVIKSGGEWISSIDLENLAVGHPDVAEAAVIGVHHPKWDERPLLVIVKKDGREPQPNEILKFMDGKIAKWWMPDDVQFVGEIPHTATGKINKLKLREAFRDYRLHAEGRGVFRPGPGINSPIAGLTNETDAPPDYRGALFACRALEQAACPVLAGGWRHRSRSSA